MMDFQDVPPHMLAHIYLFGTPVPARIKKGASGKIFNARKPYIISSKWKVKLQFREPPYDGPVRVDYFFGFPIPKSWCKENKELAARGGMPHTVKPDYDNLEKTYNDIIKKIVILDDSQITTGKWKKEYVLDPRTEIFIYYA